MCEAEKARWKATVLALVGLLGLSIILATAIGPVSISPLSVLNVFMNKLSLHSTGIEETIILQIRLPRICLAMLVGAALAVSGTTMQALFKNPMADPYIIGISSGAALGASLAIASGTNLLHAISIAAFVGGVGAAFLVYSIARVNGKVPVETLLLSGIAVAAFLAAITSLLMYLAGEDLHQIMFWLMGGLWARSWGHVAVSFPPIFLGILGIYVFARDLNVMLLGEEPAHHLGIEVEKLKKLMLVLASLIAGVAVSVSGIIGFVGLIIPHAVRILVGPDHRILIPTAALVGAIFLIWADTLARTIIAPTEVPVGIITAFFGAPFFIYLLRRRKRSRFYVGD